jgi:hypothetical protein
MRRILLSDVASNSSVVKVFGVFRGVTATIGSVRYAT